MAGLSDLNDIAVGVFRLPTADLSAVEQPKGRVDFLASKLLEAGIRTYAPGLIEAHRAIRPMIDGQLKRLLKNVKVPGVPKARAKRKVKVYAVK